MRIFVRVTMRECEYNTRVFTVRGRHTDPHTQHAHTRTHTDDLHRINFKKPSVRPHLRQKLGLKRIFEMKVNEQLLQQINVL